jgi:hypothetical protein
MFTRRPWAALAAIAFLAPLLTASPTVAQTAEPAPVADADATLALSRGFNALTLDADGAPRIDRASVPQRAARVLIAAALPTHPVRGEDIAWLVTQQFDGGGWGFGEGHPHTGENPTWTDIVNTHLAIAALADAAALGHDVPDKTFTRAIAFCLTTQNSDGGWGYTPPGAKPFRVRGASHGSATAAALATLADASRVKSDQAEQIEGAIAKGTVWLTNRFAGADDPAWVWGRQRYRLVYLYALQRFANRRGLRTLTGPSLRHEIAGALVAAQHADGTWTASGSDLMDTSTALLALSETRRPILLNFMELTARGDDEVANWVRHCRETFERPYAWQVVDPGGEPSAVSDASILYITVDDQLSLPMNWTSQLKPFVEGGGTIVVAAHTEASSELTTIAQQLAATLGPWPVLTKLDDHVVLTAEHALEPEDVDGVIVVGNGLRPVGVVLPRSIVERLQDGPARTAAKEVFQFVANVTISATGANPPAGRSPLGTSEEARFPTFQSINVARAKHNGDWYLAPRAMPALGDALAAALSLGVNEVDPIDLQNPPPRKALLWMTLTDKVSLNAFERQTLRSWLRNGGTLFIDSSAGSDAGFKATGELIKRMLDDEALTPVPMDHPLITGEFGGGIGCDLRSVDYAATVSDPPAGVSLYGVTLDGRLAIIFSPYGVTPAIADLPAVGARAISTHDARRLGINLLLWSVSGGR